MRQREADGVDGGGVERELAGDAANAVGAKELLHQIFLRIHYQACWTIWRIAGARQCAFGSTRLLNDKLQFLIATADLRTAVSAFIRR